MKAFNKSDLISWSEHHSLDINGGSSDKWFVGSVDGIPLYSMRVGEYNECTIFDGTDLSKSSVIEMASGELEAKKLCADFHLKREAFKKSGFAPINLENLGKIAKPGSNISIGYNNKPFVVYHVNELGSEYILIDPETGKLVLSENGYQIFYPHLLYPTKFTEFVEYTEA